MRSPRHILVAVVLAVSACSGTTVLGPVGTTSQTAAGSESSALPATSENAAPATQVVPEDDAASAETTEQPTLGAPNFGPSDTSEIAASEDQPAEGQTTAADDVANASETELAIDDPDLGTAPFDHESPESSPASAADPTDVDNDASTTSAAPVATPLSDDEWCAGPADQMRIAFAETMWADRPGGKSLEQALTELLDVLVELRPIAPVDLQEVFPEAIETQIVINDALVAVAWDRRAVDWNSLPAMDRNVQLTKTIDEYGAAICGLRPGFRLPDDNSPAGREQSDAFEELAAEISQKYDVTADEARCLAGVLFEYGVQASDEIRDELLSCGVSVEKLNEMGGG